MIDRHTSWGRPKHGEPLFITSFSPPPRPPQVSTLQLRYQSVCEEQQCAAVRNEALLQDVRRLKHQLSLAAAQTARLELLKVRIADHVKVVVSLRRKNVHFCFSVFSSISMRSTWPWSTRSGWPRYTEPAESKSRLLGTLHPPALP